MKLYTHVRSAEEAYLVEVDRSDVKLRSAKVVLQHAGGSLGFDRERGPELMRALVGEALVVHRANLPEWTQVAGEKLALGTLHAKFNPVVTCSQPVSSLLTELQAVSANNVQAKKNDILARNGKAIRPIQPTFFDSWVSAERHVLLSAAARIVPLCQVFAVWGMSDSGLYAELLGIDETGALAPVLAAGRALDVPVARVSSAREMPVW